MVEIVLAAESDTEELEPVTVTATADQVHRTGDVVQGETPAFATVIERDRFEGRLTIEYLADNNLIYVQAMGKSPFGSSPAEYTGGIEAINPDDFATQLILDDGDESNHPFGQILNMALVTPTQGYFIGSTAFQTNSLYRFDPTSVEVFSDVNGPVAIAGLFDANLTSLAVDRNAKL